MPALGLALGAALAWGTADFLGGLTTRGLPVLTVLIASQGIGLVALGIVVAAGGGGEAPATADVLYGMLAGVALAVGLGALYQGMGVGVMTVVSPVSAAGPRSRSRSTWFAATIPASPRERAWPPRSPA